MFTWARIKLTSIYLVIIMLVSIIFNVVIYNGVSRELQVRFVALEQRFEGLELNQKIQLHEVLLADLENAKRSLLFILLYTDALIFAASAIAGFVMAGKTLEPIEKALEEQKRFVADASHELRTPLTALKTSIEVTLRDKRLTLAKAKKTLKGNLAEVDKMRDLAAGLLTMARLTQYEDIQRKKIDIAKLANSVYLSMKPMAKSKKLKFHRSFETAHAHVDPDSVEKLIRILVDNAIKYTKKGSVTLNVRRSKKTVVIEVKDTGIGISAKDKENIFDRFYRADSSRAKSFASGFGLGLCLAKQIVELHDGTIDVKSKKNHGSLFMVSLPA